MDASDQAGPGSRRSPFDRRLPRTPVIHPLGHQQEAIGRLAVDRQPAGVGALFVDRKVPNHGLLNFAEDCLQTPHVTAKAADLLALLFD